VSIEEIFSHSRSEEKDNGANGDMAMSATAKEPKEGIRA